MFLAESVHIGGGLITLIILLIIVWALFFRR